VGYQLYWDVIGTKSLITMEKIDDGHDDVDLDEDDAEA
jgi:hypothetical protein